jgi:two-component system chemotaxis response regulator CheY
MKLCLIIDDSPIVRKIARRILEAMNFAVEEAEDGAGAIELCRRKMPDIVLIDWNMPGNTALDFLRQLRREPGGETPIVVFSTSENDVALVTEAVNAGTNEYIMKPFDGSVIQNKFADMGLV